MRWLVFAVFALALVGESIGQTPYVSGRVIIRVAPSQTLPPDNLLFGEPPLFGISSIDEALAQYSPLTITPMLGSPDGFAISAAVQRLERTFVVDYAAGADPDEVADVLMATTGVEYSHVDYKITKYYSGTKRVEPTDFAFADQWNLDDDDNDPADIDAPEAWVIEAGDPSVVIGIIDTGTLVGQGIFGVESESYYLHPDQTFFFNLFEDKTPTGTLGFHDLDGADQDLPIDLFVDNVIGCRLSKLPSYVVDPTQKLFWNAIPVNWDVPPANATHGVQVASIAAAKATGGDNIAGIANNCRVYVVRDGLGIEGTSSESEEARGIINAARFSSVINMSWGFHADVPLGEFLDALDSAIRRDCVLVAAAGNIGQGPGTIAAWPGRSPLVLCVGSISPLLVKDSTKTCRRHVTRDDWKLPELQARYAGHFSPYLQRRIDGERRRIEDAARKQRARVSERRLPAMSRRS